MIEFDIRDHTEWLTMCSETPWIVDGLVHESCTLVYAKQKAGKSLLTTDLGHALQSREPTWLGRKVHGGPYRVAFGVSDPRAEHETSRRLGGLRTEPTPVFRLKRNMDTATWNHLASKLREQRVNVLIVDSGTNLVADINAPNEVGPLMDGLNECLDAGIAVVLVHHVSAGNNAAGCYEWRSWPRWHVRMDRRVGQAALKFDGNEPAPQDLPEELRAWLPKPHKPRSRFRVVNRDERPAERTDERQTTERDLLAEMKDRRPPEGWQSQDHIAKVLNISQAKVSRTLKHSGHKLRAGTVVPSLVAA